MTDTAFDASQTPLKKPLKTQGTTKGGLLQVLSGDKTLNFGYDAPQIGELIFLTNHQDPSLRIPVVVDRVDPLTRFEDMTEAQAQAGGFSSKQNMGNRFTASMMGVSSYRRADGSSEYTHQQDWLNKHAAFRITHYHLADAAEVQAAGYAPAEIRKELSAIPSKILNEDPRHESVPPALDKIGKGEHALRQSIKPRLMGHYTAPGKEIAA